MAELEPQDIAQIIKAVPRLIRMPTSKVWMDYDEEADVLYLSFRRSQKATDSELRDDGIIVRKRGKVNCRPDHSGCFDAEVSAGAG